MFSLLIFFIHGINSMYILIPTSQFLSHDSCSWGMRIFHLTGITMKWFYMTIIDFLIVFVRPILLGTSAVLGFFFKYIPKQKWTDLVHFLLLTYLHEFWKGMGRKAGKIEVGLNMPVSKLDFLCILKVWKVIETQFTWIGCLESFLCKVRKAIISWAPALCWLHIQCVSAPSGFPPPTFENS